MKHFMTVNEAAEALKLSPWTIRNFCRLGKMPARRRRRGWLLPRKLIAIMAKEMEEGVPNSAYLQWERHYEKLIQPTQPTTYERSDETSVSLHENQRRAEDPAQSEAN